MRDREKLIKKLKGFGIKGVPFNAMLPELQDLWKNRKKLKQKEKPKETKLQEKPKEPAEPKETKEEKPKRKYTNTKTTKDLGIRCPHCGFTDRKHGGTSHTYKNGNRRMFCGECEKPFIVFKKF